MSKNKIHTLQNWLDLAHRACSDHNPKAPELIVGKVLKLNKSQILGHAAARRLTKKELAKLNNLLGKVLAGRPLAPVLGQTEFYNLKLKVNSNVLAPRPETEQLVQFAVQNIPPDSKVLDIGCGSGAIGLSVSKARPDLIVTLSDISPKALSLSKINSVRNALQNQNISFRRSNLIKKFVQQELQGYFFLANLPYVSRSWPKLNKKSLGHEPKISLFAKNNGLQIIENLIISLTSHQLLTSTNWLLIEHDPKQLTDLQKFCKKLNLSLEEVSGYVSKISTK